MTDGQPCRVLLVGMMGSGKSTVGRLLAAATGWSYVDNDELVRRAHGTTARDLLAKRGEALMRRAESDALALGLELAPPVIVGVAAGTILDAADRHALRDGGIVVWLRADADALESRARGAEHRPWLDRGGTSWIRTTVAERDPLYASVAHITLDTGSATAADTARVLHDRLRSFDGCAPGVSAGGFP